MNDLTIVWYTAQNLPKNFYFKCRETLAQAAKDAGIESVIEIYQPHDIPRSHLQIYRNALEGAKQAKTRYIALCEDDVLYHPDHFTYRPPAGVFAYNMNVWSIFTWVKPPIFNYKDRINLSGLICERELFIEAMEERFAKHPDDSKIDISVWAEPGKYEGYLEVTKRQFEKFYTDNPNVAFSHETALSFENMGKRKAMGKIKAIEIPFWGSAQDVLKIYEQ